MSDLRRLQQQQVQVYIYHIIFKCFILSPKLSLSQSQIITLYPNWIKGLTVVDQETEGNITVLFLRKFPSNKVCAIKRLAEEPEFTNIE